MSAPGNARAAPDGSKPVRRGSRIYAVVNAALLCALVGALALLASLEVTPADTVRVPWLDRELPESCPYLIRTGRPCPSCGVTRSLVSAVHGDLDRSRRFHAAGGPILLMLVVQIAMRVAFLRPQLRRPVLDLVVSVGMAVCFAVVLN